MTPREPPDRAGRLVGAALDLLDGLRLAARVNYRLARFHLAHRAHAGFRRVDMTDPDAGPSGAAFGLWCPSCGAGLGFGPRVGLIAVTARRRDDGGDPLGICYLDGGGPG